MHTIDDVPKRSRRVPQRRSPLRPPTQTPLKPPTQTPLKSHARSPRATLRAAVCVTVCVPLHAPLLAGLLAAVRLGWCAEAERARQRCSVRGEQRWGGMPSSPAARA